MGSGVPSYVALSSASLDQRGRRDERSTGARAPASNAFCAAFAAGHDGLVMNTL